MKYFYSDATNNPVGPIDEAQLRGLFRMGTIIPKSYILAEGQTDWVTYDSVFAIEKHVTKSKAFQLPSLSDGSKPVINLKIILICTVTFGLIFCAVFYFPNSPQKVHASAPQTVQKAVINTSSTSPSHLPISASNKNIALAPDNSGKIIPTTISEFTYLQRIFDEINSRIMSAPKCEDPRGIQTDDLERELSNGPILKGTKSKELRLELLSHLRLGAEGAAKVTNDLNVVRNALAEFKDSLGVWKETLAREKDISSSVGSTIDLGSRQRENDMNNKGAKANRLVDEWHRNAGTITDKYFREYIQSAGKIDAELKQLRTELEK